MMSVRLKEKEAEVQHYMTLYNDQMNKSDAAALAVIEDSMKKAVLAYNEQARNEMFSECLKADLPVVEVLKKYYYDGIYAKKYTVKGVFLGYVEADRQFKVDLLEFCEYADLPTLWVYKVERMGQMLTRRNAEGVGKAEADLSEIDKSYYLSDGARAAKLKCETPTSNTQMLKLMQEIVDSIVFVPSANNPEKNKYRPNNYDLFFFDHLYSTKNREDALRVKSPKALRELMTIVLHRLVVDGVYDVNYRIVKRNRPAPTKTETKPEEPKDEAKDAPTDAPKADTDEAKAA